MGNQFIVPAALISIVVGAYLLATAAVFLLGRNNANQISKIDK